MMFAIGLVSFFISGGLTGIFLGNAAIDIQLHDTYFVVAHFHLVMGCAAIFGMMAGIYHWYPRLYGRTMNKTLGYMHFWLTFISAYMVFFPMHFIGLAGVPRRYYQFSVLPEFGVWDDVNVLITMAAILGAAAQLLFLYNFFSSIFFGKKSEQNPWKANTLEWTAPVERIHGNWPGAIPTVYRWPYDYSHPDYEDDFVLQTVPDKGNEESIAHSQTAPVTPEKTNSPEVVHFSALLLRWLGLRNA
jgi:cytochrome c oxidase subunit 1